LVRNHGGENYSNYKLMYEFNLDPEEIIKFEEWSVEQKQKNSSMPTAGERWTFMFTPTGLGTIKAVKDECTGEELDLTDWKNL
jgi:hypothetical protein